MFSNNQIKQYDAKKKVAKLNGFIGDKIEIKNAYYLKSFNENQNESFLKKLIQMIEKRNFLMLFLFPNNKQVSFDKLDEHGIIKVVNIYYELYFIINKKQESYFLLIKENAFFHSNPQNEIVYFEEAKSKNNLFWFFNRTKIV